MAYVVGFRISGLAGRQSVYQQELKRDLNVFFGPNGCGKTSLLRILHSAMANDASILHRTEFKKADVRIFSTDANRVITRTFEPKPRAKTPTLLPAPWESAFPAQQWTTSEMNLTFSTSNEEVNWVTTGLPANKKPTRLFHEYLPTARLFAGVSPQHLIQAATNRRAVDEDMVDDAFAGLLIQRWKEYSSQVLRQVQRAQAQGLVRILQAFLSAELEVHKEQKAKPDLERSYERLQSFLKRQHASAAIGNMAHFSDRYRSDDRLRRVVDDIDQVEQGIAAAMHSRARFQELVNGLFTGKKTLAIDDAEISVRVMDGEKIALANLSSGEKQLLRILVDVMSASANSVLIDEPEISMHVDWQARFVEVAKAVNPDCQLLIATHSPEVVGPVPDDNLFRMD